MARYMLAQLNDGVASDGTRVVSEENLRTTFAPTVPITAMASYDEEGEPEIVLGEGVCELA